MKLKELSKNMNNNKKTSHKILRIIAFFAVGIIIGFGAGFVIGKIIKPMIYADISSADVALTLFLALVFFVLSFIIHIVVHEAGHMIAAMARGWKFLSFMIMGVVLNRRNGRLRLSRFSMAGAAGQCLMLPPENGDTPFGIALYNAGGVLANLLITVIASVILFMPSTHHSLTATVFLLCVIIVGLYLIIMNGIPHKLAGLPNDGLNMLSLRNDKFATMVFLRSMRLIGYLMQDDTSRLEAMTYMCDDRDINFSNPIHVMALSSDLSLAMLRMDFGKANAIMQRAELHISRMITITATNLPWSASTSR